MRKPQARFRVEPLEPRTLLAAESPFDDAFNTNAAAAGVFGPIKVLPNGQILVDQNAAGSIVRLNPDGSPDPTFNPAGVLDDWKPGTARQDDGKLLSLSDGVLTRYNPDGSLDTSFGTAGRVDSFFADSNYPSFTPKDVAFSNNRIVLAGAAAPVPGNNPDAPVLGVEELDLTGAPDARFGLHYLPWNPDFSPQLAEAVRLKVAPDGTFLVAVTPGHVFRFKPTGAHDHALLGPVKPQYNMPYILDIAPAPGGKIVVAGYTGQHAAFARLNADLTPDPTFGELYINSIQLQESIASRADYIATQSDGNVIASVTDSSGISRLLRMIGTHYLHQSPTITGRVFDDLNRDGIQQTGEPGIPGIRIFDGNSENSVQNPFDTTAVTDADGDFTLSHIPSPGPQYLRQVRSGTWFQSTPSGEGPLVVNFDEQTGTSQPVVFADVARSTVGTIAGRVSAGPFPQWPWNLYLDLNHDGVRQDDEPSTTSGANGGYQFNGIAPGDYDLRDGVRPGWRQSSPAVSGADPETNTGGTGLQHITVRPGRTTRVDFDETRVLVARITGTVFYDTNKNGIRDPGEHGMYHVFLSLRDQRFTYTNGRGDYTFDDVLSATSSFAMDVPAPNHVHLWKASTPTTRNLHLRRPGVYRHFDFGLYVV